MGDQEYRIPFVIRESFVVRFRRNVIVFGGEWQSCLLAIEVPRLMNVIIEGLLPKVWYTNHFVCRGQEHDNLRCTRGVMEDLIEFQS